MTLTTDALIAEAKQRGWSVTPLGWRGSMVVSDGSRDAWLLGTVSDRTSHLAVLLAGDKSATKWRLARCGVPVPKGVLVDDEDGAVAAWRRLGGAVVVKPNLGCKGRGARAGLDNEAGVRAAWRAAAESAGRVLVERHHGGRNLRVLVVDDRAVAAAEHLAPTVEGDGLLSIEQLVAQENGRRADNGADLIVFDAESDDWLETLALGRHSVPALGQCVVLSSVLCGSRGAPAREVSVRPANAELAVRAARAVGLDIAGVDLICPSADKEAVVIEVNASPGLALHADGGRPAAAAILDYLMRDDGRAPARS